MPRDKNITTMAFEAKIGCGAHLTRNAYKINSNGRVKRTKHVPRLRNISFEILKWASWWWAIKQIDSQPQFGEPDFTFSMGFSCPQLKIAALTQLSKTELWVGEIILAIEEVHKIPLSMMVVCDCPFLFFHLKKRQTNEWKDMG